MPVFFLILCMEGIPDHDRGDINKALHAPLDNIRTAMEINTYGPVLLIQRFVPLMLR